ncbi:hypothetical protein AB4486_20475 [Vibrio sp. 10N.222.55.C6]|uniref:hypothetical protein n=1 Tax=Vibrio sp. 10N.222.55.C6 TaxID=3229649 RepID=UPI00354EDB76
MKKLAFAVGLAIVSSSALADREVDFSGYQQISGSRLGTDNQSVVLEQNNTGSSVHITQGASGFDGNRSVVDMRLQGHGTNNKVKLTQSGGYSFNDSLVKIAGTSGAAKVIVDQDGKYHDSEVKLFGDSDYATVTVTQTGMAHWSDVGVSGDSDSNTVTVTQEGRSNDSIVNISESSDNRITVSQGNSSGDHKNLSNIALRASSNDNLINVTQTGSHSESQILLTASSGNQTGNYFGGGSGINVNQTSHDYSFISMNGTTNSAVYVNQK